MENREKKTKAAGHGMSATAFGCVPSEPVEPVSPAMTEAFWAAGVGYQILLL